MKNKFFSSIIVLLTLTYLPSLNAAEIAKKRIAVQNFKSTSSEAVNEAKLLTEQLIIALRTHPSLDVLKGQSESVNSDYTVTGTVSQPADINFIINLQIFAKTSTSKPIYAKKLIIDSKNYNGEQLNKSAVCQIENIINETLFPLKIKSIEGAYAYLEYNPGSRLKNKMKIEVLIPSAYSVDPVTGEVVKGSEYPIGELKVTEIQPEFAKAQIIRYSSPIEPGAFCRTIPEC